MTTTLPLKSEKAARPFQIRYEGFQPQDTAEIESSVRGSLSLTSGQQRVGVVISKDGRGFTVTTGIEGREIVQVTDPVLGIAVSGAIGKVDSTKFTASNTFGQNERRITVLSSEPVGTRELFQTVHAYLSRVGRINKADASGNKLGDITFTILSHTEKSASVLVTTPTGRGSKGKGRDLKQAITNAIQNMDRPVRNSSSKAKVSP